MAVIYPTIEHLRQRARRRIPRVAFDYLDGEAGTERGVARNSEAFANILFMPRALTGCETRSQTKSLFGEQYSAPFGMAPIGLAGFMWPRAEIANAGAAAAANIPYILSTAATTSIERVAEITSNRAWFQLYVGRDHAIVLGLLERAEHAGLPTLVVTVDVPAPGRRLRDIRNKFTVPLRWTPRIMFDILTHPAWALATLRAGPPRFVNIEPYAPAQTSAQSLAKIQFSQSSARLNWKLLGEIRKLWPRKLVVKGLMHPDDAVRAAEAGVDGVIVSNHGGRQLESAPAPIEMLPLVRKAVGDDFALMLDGGIRTGEDIAKALALGADFVFCGRAFMYGLAALGPKRGPAAAIEILTDELDRVLAQLGCFSVEELCHAHIFAPQSG